MKKILVVLLFISCLPIAKADEGMWLPFLLQQLNSTDMQLRGLKIPVDEIYSANKSSLKDAVVLFGGGCTGAMISNDGLLITNHHCGNSSIQYHSTVEHNYLHDGFWAKNKKEELPVPNLTVTFIVRMEDVTSQIIPFLNEQLSENERAIAVKKLGEEIEKKAVAGTHFSALVKSIFEGNEYILIVSEIFTDVRMVGAPPTSIGNFGGETDNWMWPRQTGDFSLFRVYAGKDNKPAVYNADNVPFHPRYSFPISLKGVKEGDFTMVYGFPGRTQEYLSSYAVDLTMNNSNPNRIAVRTKKIAVMEKYMKQDEKTYIQYAAKIRSLANAYKKWKGEVSGLKKNHALEQKRIFETAYLKWAAEDDKRNNKYGSVLSNLKNIYNEFKKYITAADFYSEAGAGVEILNYAATFNKLIELSTAEKPDQQKISEEALRLLKGTEGFFKNYCPSLDKDMFAEMMELYSKNVDPSLIPLTLENANHKYKGNLAYYADEVFRESVFADEAKLHQLLTDFTVKKAKVIRYDPAFLLTNDLIDTYTTKTGLKVTDIRTKLAGLNRLYIAGIREMQTGKKLYPDANSTLRVSYGNVKGYEPRDAVQYDYYTTTEGIIEKADSSNEEFEIPPRLKMLIDAHQFGRYGNDGNLPVAFIATNHTTGGNSGSPVLNASGQLIGLNYDRVWEGTMSDLKYDADRCRNITLDIRYALFIIDLFADAGNLLNEMNITQ